MRKGYELEASFYPANSSDFSVFGSYGWVDARVIDPTYSGTVPSALYLGTPTIKGGVTIQRCFGPDGRVLADLYYQYSSGTPYYRTAGLLLSLRFLSLDRTMTCTISSSRTAGNGWSSFFSARCQPREFSSYYTWVSSDYLVFDPPPKWEVAAGLTYNFW